MSIPDSTHPYRVNISVSNVEFMNFRLVLPRTSPPLKISLGCIVISSFFIALAKSSSKLGYPEMTSG